MHPEFATRENVSATRELPTAPSYSALTIAPLPAPPTPPPTLPPDGTQGHGYLAQVYEHRLIPSLYLDSGLVSPAAYKAVITSDQDTLT
jgi:hypothetical protein